MKIIQPMIVECQGKMLEVKLIDSIDNGCAMCDMSEVCHPHECADKIGVNSYLKEIKQ
jgi:hypothetical protein